MNDKAKLSLAKRSYQRTLNAENKIWEKLHCYFHVNERLLTVSLVGVPEHEICNYPGLLSFIETEKLFDDKYITAFFHFEREAEPECPCPLFLSENTHPKEWEMYYRAATRYHQERTKVLRRFIGKIIATIETPIELGVAN